MIQPEGIIRLNLIASLLFIFWLLFIQPNSIDCTAAKKKASTVVSIKVIFSVNCRATNFMFFVPFVLQLCRKGILIVIERLIYQPDDFDFSIDCRSQDFFYLIFFHSINSFFRKYNELSLTRMFLLSMATFNSPKFGLERTFLMNDFM